MEAGGRITDIDGADLRFNKPEVKVRGLIASNGPLHDQLTKLARTHKLPN
jgi:3'-phosphoadenosine 5'-phosphosulfate (PAPS) 3'-phosphatase